MTVKIKSTLPKGDFAHLNGLEDAHDAIVQTPKRQVVAVVVMSVANVDKDIITGYQTPRMQIEQIELVNGADLDELLTMVDRIHENRTGRAPLPGLEGKVG